MPSPVLSIRIEGTRNAEGRVDAFPREVLQRLRSRASRRAEKTISRFKQEMAQEYTSAWATGRLAAGIKKKVSIVNGGVDIQFTIPSFRELRYVTALGGGHFSRFPVAPFEITPVAPGKALVIPFPSGRARRFIRGERGRFAGSRGGAIVVKKVLWGKRTGGFSRDVLSEVAQEEGALFVEDMQKAVQDAVIKITT